MTIRINKSIALYFIFILSISNVQLSFAQETEDSLYAKIYSLSLEELMNIKISGASNIITNEKAMPVSVTTIKSNQLMLSGARTLSEAIMVYVPGFFLTEDQDDYIAGFRGLSPDNNSKILLLLNGQKLNNEWFWGAPTALLHNINFDYIEKVEIIRGPGSVTLGQGALLGVINIITKQSGDSYEFGNNDASLFGSNNEYIGINAGTSIQDKSFNAYFHVASAKYNGQNIRNEGWAKEKDNAGYKGGTVFDIGTRLKRCNNNFLFGRLNFGNNSFQFLYSDIKKDLYNFYRDRNVFEEMLASLYFTNSITFSKNIKLKTDFSYSFDNFNLESVDGFTMGGIRENRYGVKSIANIDNIIPHNKLAFGFEYERYEFGRRNLDGNNFISNLVDTNTINHYSDYLISSNQNKIWGYSGNINVASVILENIYTLYKNYNFIVAARFDIHPYWGSNISPRFGIVASPYKKLSFRLTYQTGFRGASGLHYIGGYRNDGFLYEDNFDKIRAANIPIFQDSTPTAEIEQDIPKVEPEKNQNIELAVDYNPTNNFNFNVVGFYNIISNVIDVGQIYRDPKYFTMVNIGTDIPGDWNGYWFYKNNHGELKEAGMEISASYRTEYISINASHSLVRIVDANNQLRGSMYVTNGKHIRTFPENISRLNAIISLNNKVTISPNIVYYHYWYSPSEQYVNGNIMVNLSAMYKLTNKLSLSFSIINLLGQSNLYPMNNNTGGPERSDGTPSYEKTNIWLKLNCKF